MNIQGQRIGIVGAAKSGLAAAKVLHRLGAQVLLSDSQTLERLREAVDRAQLPAEIVLETGGHTERLLTSDFVVLSPGVPPDIPILRQVRDRNIPILSEIEIAFRISHGKRLVVTGSNGKTTTTSLLYAICRKHFGKVFLGGNIGFPMIEFAPETTSDSVQVLEVSSFQLETISEFKPDIGLITNFFPNHLDRYSSYEAYVCAKERLAMNMGPQEWIVLNSDQPAMQEIASRLRCRTAWFGRKAPDKGPWTTLRGDTFVHVREDGTEEVLFESTDVKILGRHNQDNVMAASMVALLSGVLPAEMAGAVREFPGVEHRLEWVREVSQVAFVNDSKGTNCAAAIIALQACSQPVILIAGGRDKGTELLEWVNAVKERARGVVLLGEAQQRFRSALEGIVPLKCVKSLEDAVNTAYGWAEPGDCVLLSPACSSYDMFPNFEVRGTVFKNLVHALVPKD